MRVKHPSMDWILNPKQIKKVTVRKLNRKKVGFLFSLIALGSGLAFGAAQTRFNSDVIMTQNATVSGTLGVGGNSTLASLGVTGNETVGGTLGVTGLSTLASLGVTGNASVGGTLGVTGLSTLASLGVTGNETVGGTLGVTGASTLASLGVTNNATVGGTLGVTGASTLASLGVTNNETVGGTLGVTGLSTLASLAVTSGATAGSLTVYNTATVNDLVSNQTATIATTLGVGGLATLNSASITNSCSIGTTLDVASTSAFVGSVKIGATGSAAASSLLDLESTTKGFIQPRMTTTQRDAISSPTNGLGIYNTSSKRFNYYNSTQSAWKEITPGTGTSGYVAIFDSNTDLSAEATLAKSRGGTGADNSSVTFPSSGTITTDAGTSTFTNKTYDAAGTGNVLSNVANSNISSTAAIARTKIANGSANHVVINDGSGTLSSEAQLAKTRGGTGADNSSVTFPSTGTIVTRASVDTLNNKTLATTTTKFGDTSDNSKQLGFDTSGATTGKTLTISSSHSLDRTWSLIDTSDTFAGISASQVFSNKNLQDATVAFVSDADSSKKLKFSLTGATTATTMTLVSSHSTNRTWTLIDTSDTFAGISASQTFTNKSIDAANNTITNISNTEIKTGAAITRAKLANGSANHVLINDGSGIISSEAQLGQTRGGTGVNNGGMLNYGSDNVTFITSGPTTLTLPTSGTVVAFGNLITAWGSYSSVNSSWGNSVVTYTSYYRRMVDSGDFRIGLRLSNTVSGTLNFTQAQLFGSLSLTVNTSKLPTQSDNRIAIGEWVGYDNGQAIYGGEVMFNVEGSSNDFYLTNNSNNTLSSTTPFTWNSNDSLTVDIHGLPINEWN